MSERSQDKDQQAQAQAQPQAQPQQPRATLAMLPHIPIGHPDTMMSVESVRRAVEEFRVCPSDIIVSTFAKTGTTLVCWLCHLIRTRGRVDYDAMETLYEVVPWPLLSWDIGYDPNTAGSQFFPRVFKSHLRMASVYRGCRYIVTIRDPAQTALSFYNFLLAKQVPVAQQVDVSTFLMTTPFVQGRPGRASLWDYYQEYHLLKSDCCRDTVLVLVYEDLVQDKRSGIRMIAQFMGLSVDEITEDLVDRVATQSTKEYMAQHMTLFDEPYERAKQLGRAGDLQQLAPGAKISVRKHPQTLNDEAQVFLAQKWQDTMAPLGYDNYEAFAAEFRAINQKRVSSAS